MRIFKKLDLKVNFKYLGREFFSRKLMKSIQNQKNGQFYKNLFIQKINF